MAEKDSSRTRKAGRFEDARGRPVTLLGPYEMNRPMLEDESEALQPSIHRETPFSDELWRGRTAGDSASNPACPPRPTTRDRRKEAQDAIKRLSGKPAGCVSKKTDLGGGESPGSKFDKAKQLGIKTISKKEFLKLIGKR